MEENQNYILLKEFSLNSGASLFGVADIAPTKKDFVLPERILEKFDKAVSLGIRLSQSVLEEIEGHPTRLYFHHYRTLNASLDQLALRLTNLIQEKGFQALPIPASQILDWQKQTAHLSHKKIAYLAGLGWIGRNNLLVNKELGSQFRLVTVLTDMPLKIDSPTKDTCGSCLACVKICPCQAIKENPDDFGHQACFEKLKEFQKQRFTEQFICGICVNACRKAE